MGLLFWLGVSLLLTAGLIFLASVLSCVMYCKDDSGLEIFCLFPFSITFVVGGIFCMVSGATWSLVVIIIVNLLSAFIHMFTSWKCTGWNRAEYDGLESGWQSPECEAKKSWVSTAWIRLLPELMGIVLSLVAVGAATYQLSL